MITGATIATELIATFIAVGVTWWLAGRQREWDARKPEFDAARSLLTQIDRLLTLIIERPLRHSELQVDELKQLIGGLDRLIVRASQESNGLYRLRCQLQAVKASASRRSTDWERQRQAALAAKPYIAVARGEIDKFLGPRARPPKPSSKPGRTILHHGTLSGPAVPAKDGGYITNLKAAQPCPILTGLLRPLPLCG
jgi:hypothetical protein